MNDPDYDCHPDQQFDYDNEDAAERELDFSDEALELAADRADRVRDMMDNG